MKPFFSIIIPTYNSESCIKGAIENILDQTFSDYEIIIMDGGSKDKTIEIAAACNDLRIKIFSEPDKGVYDAMNKGMDRANGEWLYFMGSDDYLYKKNVLEVVAEKLQKTKKHVLYGNVLIQGNTGWATDGQVYNGKFSFQKLLKSNICHQSMFYRRSFVHKNYLQYDLKYPVSADWDFNIACRLHTRFSYIDSIIAVFNAGGISTGTINEPFLQERKVKYAHLYKKYKPGLLQRIVNKMQTVWKKALVNS